MKIFEIHYTALGTGEEKMVFVMEKNLERRKNGDIIYKLDETVPVSITVPSRNQLKIRTYEIPDAALIQYGLMEAEML